MDVFKAKHPGVTNVVGGWTGWLRNSGEKLELVDSAGAVVNTVRYAHQGDWGVRELGPASSGQRGWQWSGASDGDGKSLELINTSLPNEFGQNWAAGIAKGGTPGKANSVAAGDIAPMILEACHGPMIPRSADPVTVTARILDEQTTGLVVTLRYRLDSSTYVNQNTYPTFIAGSYLSVPMFDDGAHGDGKANDGVFGGVIAAQPSGKIVEFYIEARDAGGKTRTWPAPSMVDGTPQQVTNALYQVDDAFKPLWTPGSQPVYYLIMTEMERGRLAYIGTHSNRVGTRCADERHVHQRGRDRHADALQRGSSQPRPREPQWAAQQPACGLRGRQDLERSLRPQFQLPQPLSTDRWAARSFAWRAWSAPVTTPVQLRINGANLATDGWPMYGVYARLDAFDSVFAKQQFSNDPDGNLYACFRDAGEADFRYFGDQPQFVPPQLLQGKQRLAG